MDDVTPDDIAAAEAAWNAEADEFNQWSSISIGEQEALAAEMALVRTASQPEAKAAALMTDEFLLRAWQRTSGEPGDSEADALLAEIQRRELDI